jgi:hypothetical protein
MRPPGTEVHWGAIFGFHENSTALGKVLGFAGGFAFLAGLVLFLNEA